MLVCQQSPRLKGGKHEPGLFPYSRKAGIHRRHGRIGHAADGHPSRLASLAGNGLPDSGLCRDRSDRHRDLTRRNAARRRADWHSAPDETADNLKNTKQ